MINPFSLTPKGKKECFHISSMLPSNLRDETGFTENDIIKSSKLILNQPYKSIKRVPRVRLIPEPHSFDENPRSSETTKEATSSLNCFEVKLSNCTVLAFSIYEHQKEFGCGVVVRDGAYLRYGTIVRQIPQEESRVSAYQIIEFDKDNKLGEYIKKQTDTAKQLIQAYLASHKESAIEVKEVETVSYGSRATLSIYVNNSNEEINESLARFLITVFGIAVEICE